MAQLLSDIVAGPRGLNRLSRYLLLFDGLLLFVTAFLFVRLNLSLAWPTVIQNACMIGLLIAVWLTYAVGPLRGREVMLAETFLAAILLLLYANFASPAQYPAVALKRPLIDPWLAAADSALGIHVPTLAAWTRARPLVSLILTAAYFTLLPQFVLTMLLIGLGLIAATVMSGAHFFVDILATLAMFAGSVYVYRALNIDRLTKVDEPLAPPASEAVA